MRCNVAGAQSLVWMCGKLENICPGNRNQKYQLRLSIMLAQKSTQEDFRRRGLGLVLQLWLFDGEGFSLRHMRTAHSSITWTD